MSTDLVLLMLTISVTVLTFRVRSLVITLLVVVRPTLVIIMARLLRFRCLVTVVLTFTVVFAIRVMCFSGEVFGRNRPVARSTISVSPKEIDGDLREIGDDN